MRFFVFLVMFALLAAPSLAQAPAGGARPAGTAQAAATGDAANGKKLFSERGCYQCHNTVAQGGAAGPRLAPNPSPFAAFSKQLRTPSDQMPPYTSKVLSDKELADLYAFLLTVPPPPAVSSIPMLNR